MLVELRIGGGGKGCQTVFPGSTHPTGELIEWEPRGDGAPAIVDGGDLLRRVERLAACALLAKYWPGHGARHNVRLPVAGVLRRAGLSQSDAEVFVEALARAVSNEDTKDFKAAVKSTYALAEAGKPYTGLPTLKEIFGDKIADKVAEWLRYRESADEAPHADDAEIDLSDVYFDGDAPPEPVPMLIDRLLPLEGLTIIGGQSGAGKSFFAIDLGVALATQSEFFRRTPLKRVGVIYIAAEGKATINARLAAAKKARGISEKIPFAVVRNAPDLADQRERAAFIKKLRAIAKRLEAAFEIRVGAVIIDALISAFTIKDENAAGELSQVCKAATEIGDSIGAATIPLAHYGKDKSTGIRGSSATRGFGESVLAIMGDRDETTGKCSNRHLVHAKSRVSDEGPIANLELRNVTLTDVNGDEFMVAHLVVGRSLEGEDAPAELKTKGRPLSHAGKAFVEAMQEALASVGKRCRPLPGMPEVVAVDRERVRQDFYPRWPADGNDKQKADVRKKAFVRGFEAAKDAGLVSMVEVEGVQLVWLIRKTETP